MCDVLLLADVFENFRTTCIIYYKLDPANYMTTPSLAWDAMQLKTQAQLELLHDLDMLNMIDKMQRGGLCFVGSKRCVKTDNQHMPDYDPNKPSNYIIYKMIINSTVVACLNTYLTKTSFGMMMRLLT